MAELSVNLPLDLSQYASNNVGSSLKGYDSRPASASQLDPNSVLSPRTSRPSPQSSKCSRHLELSRAGPDNVSQCEPMLSAMPLTMGLEPASLATAAVAFGSPLCLSPNFPIHMQLPASYLGASTSHAVPPGHTDIPGHTRVQHAPCKPATPPMQPSAAPSPMLMVFNLNPQLTRQHLEAVFSRIGPLHSLVPMRSSKATLAAFVHFKFARDAAAATAALNQAEVPKLSASRLRLIVEVHNPPTKTSTSQPARPATKTLPASSPASKSTCTPHTAHLEPATPTDYLAAARSMLAGQPASAHTRMHPRHQSGSGAASRISVHMPTRIYHAMHQGAGAAAAGAASVAAAVTAARTHPHPHHMAPPLGQPLPQDLPQLMEWTAAALPPAPPASRSFRRQLSAPLQTVQEQDGEVPAQRWWHNNSPEPASMPASRRTSPHTVAARMSMPQLQHQQHQQALPPWAHPPPVTATATPQMLLDAGQCLSQLASHPAAAATTSLHPLQALLASGDPVLLELTQEQPQVGSVVVGSVVEGPLGHHPVAMLAASMHLTLEGLQRQGLSLA